ncbi:hypothetical protein HYDPIDRAFT_50055, partial [Hydnomerulius pinastri MD-312]
RRQDFEYLSQPFQDRLLFFCTLPEKRDICVKFELPGGWSMVVMDRLLPEEYLEFYNSTPTASLIGTIRTAPNQLHQEGYVHSNIRDTNIMVSRSNEVKFMLVDFDWAGKIGEVRCPMNVNRGPDLWRPRGAVDAALVMADHDMDMLDSI